MYVKFWKRLIDIVLSGIGLIILCIPMLIIAIIIKIDDPGPAIFKQKRVGIHKTYFYLYKFRSMKVNTPDIPTHLMENPEQYITKVGAFIRKTSIDELPQLWNILKGDLSVCGPRPALWNQENLLEERDKYGANDVKPGLTGWAQINGRDELEIPVKAKLDGEYVQKMSFRFDLRCLFGTVFAVLREDGVVEGGIGKLNEQNKEQRGISDEVQEEIAGEDQTGLKRILITGAGSYIGESFKKYMEQWQDGYQVDSISMRGEAWKNVDFSAYDVVFHVAGIAHVKETKENESLYYQVNRDLAVLTAEIAKASGVKQFIFMSSMSIYGVNTGVITKETFPKPTSNYGKSKLEAEQVLSKLADDSFSVAILRPPMVYGKDCKGNFQTVIRLVQKLPAFPKVDNQRSMIYIDHLCAFVKLCIDKKLGGLYFPQNRDYVQTTGMAGVIADAMGEKIHMNKFFGFCVKCSMPFLGILQKAFGTLIYSDTEEFGFSYCSIDNDESIRRSV